MKAHYLRNSWNTYIDRNKLRTSPYHPRSNKYYCIALDVHEISINNYSH